jgi:twinkle protein
MGNCLAKISHSCGTRSGLQVFEREDGTVDGYCFSCNTFVRHPYGEEKNVSQIPVVKIGKTREEIQQEINEINSYQVFDLPDRKLRKASLERYGIKIGVDETDGVTPRLHYYPYTDEISGKVTGYKVRLIENKRMWSVGDVKKTNLFGWEQAVSTGAKRLIITEGELDAVALSRIIEMHTKAGYEETQPAVCSLPHGAASAHRDLSRLAPKIRKHFKEVSFCFDNDEAGQRAIEDACKVFPEATVITLPEKDANDCIIKGVTRAAFNASIFNAVKPKNSRLVWLDDIWEDSKEPAELGVSYPWAAITKLTRGIRKGETIYIGAAQKMGKSEVVNSLASHLVIEHNWKVLLAKPEESNKKTVKLIAGKVASKRFHDPDVAFDDAAYEQAGKKLLGNKVCMVNLYQHLGWDTLKQDIHSAAGEGVDAVFIDPITNLTNGMSSAEANTKLQEIAQELSAMALDLNIVIFIFCHLRNPDSGLPHDRGGSVLTSQFAGSRAMGRSCNYMFGLEGNKDPSSSEEERNQRTLVLLDDREFGEVGRVSLYWDKVTTQFNEIPI